MAARFQPKPAATVTALLALCVLIGLGVWQLQRLEWKTALLAEIALKMAEKTVPLPEKIDDPKAWQYRPVSVVGRYIMGPFLIKPRTHEGRNGGHLVMPFKRASGGVVFVNRGWVSDETLDQVKTEKGTLKVEGVATLPEKSAYTPENAPAKNDWYWIDAAAMAQAAGLQAVSPVVIQIAASAPGVYPIAVPVVQNIRNDHKKYAFFWFGMAGILAAIYVIYHLRGKEDGSV